MGGFFRHGSAERHTEAVSALAQRIEAGEDLTSFLSDRLKQYGYVRPRLNEQDRTLGVEWEDKDYALNAYDTHHLHLISAGTRELLYTTFTRDEAFFVMLGDHNSFDDGSLARAVAEARVGTPYEIKGILGFQRETTDREWNRLQRRGFSTFSSRDSGHFVAGGMLSVTGMSSFLVMHGNKWMRTIEELKAQVDTLKIGRAWFAQANRPYPLSPSWEYAPEYCDPFLIERSSKVAFPIVKWRR